MTWPIYRLWGLLLWLTRNQPNEWGQCPWCGDDSIDWMKKPWFESTGGGTSYIPGEPITHWGEGWQACPRCYYKWFLQGSD